ncbi:MAG: glycosyltransferase family 2 protein [Candidatus Aenigmarchaeota archaeon]|nr:glycosyltransferase family 2 protein [Candidatus Aenigmarchaeota archaeon]
MKTYALICAYNEEKMANLVIKNTLNHVDKVIFVNDGSEDKTFEKVKNEFGKNRKVIIISYKKNRGKGYATRLGFKRFLKENGDILVTLDSDGQHDPKEIKLLLSQINDKNCDIIIGTRYKGETKQPGIRKFFNKMSSIIVKMLSSGDFDDVASGFRCYSKKAIKIIEPSLKLDGFGIEPEILQIAGRNNLKAKSVQISCKYDKGKEKKNLWKMGMDYIRYAIKYKSGLLKN